MNRNPNEIVKVDLPHSDSILGLGISSIVLSLLTGLIGILLGIIALHIYNKPYLLFKMAPELYFENSYRNIRVGRVLSIIGIVLSSLFLLVYIVVFYIIIGFSNLFN